MKTNELIRLLQEADPDNECEVTVMGKDIYFAERVEGYWDGYYETLIHDPNLKGKCYSIIGGRVTTEGDKVRLWVVSIEDAMNDCDSDEDLDNFKLEFDLTYTDPKRRGRIKKKYARAREGARWLTRLLDAEKEHGKDSEEAKACDAKWREFCPDEE